MTFYTKLNPRIIDHIDQYYATSRPQTREDMVKFAAQIHRRVHSPEGGDRIFGVVELVRPSEKLVPP